MKKRTKAAGLKLRAEMISAESLYEKLAIIQRTWSEDEAFCRSYGVSETDHGANYETIAKRIREELREKLLVQARVFPCDRKSFWHSYFERGGWAPPSMTFSVFEPIEHHEWAGGIIQYVQD